MTSNRDTYELAAVPEAIAAARSIVDDATAQLPLSLRDDAGLLVSELMSNAVRHGGANVTLAVRFGDGWLTVEVHDDGPGRPVLPVGSLDPAVASGRGLRFLDRLAEEWGVTDDRAGSGKTVWFRLATEPAANDSDNMREDRTVWS